VAPNQPFLHKGIYKWWLLASALVFAIWASGCARTEHVLDRTIDLSTLSANDPSLFIDPLVLAPNKNIRIGGRYSVQNSWVYVEGEFVDQKTGLIQEFGMPIEYYAGVEDGEAWSEGSQDSSVMVSGLPDGKYVLRLAFELDKAISRQGSVVISIDQGVPNGWHLLIALLALAVIPFFIFLAQMSFEQRRWADSDYSPYPTGTGGGDDE
jgi:hypothetical protein